MSFIDMKTESKYLLWGQSYGHFSKDCPLNKVMNIFSDATYIQTIQLLYSFSIIIIRAII